jgi:HTH-like domain
MRFRFIEDRRADYPVTIMCGVLGVSPAGYYAWRSRPESRRSTVNRELVDDIQLVHRNNYGRYGSPRIHAELQAQGRGVSRGRIERLMRHHGIRAIMARPRRVRTTDSRHDLPIARICLIGTSSPPRRTGSGSPTSPTSKPIRGGSIWPPSWTCTAAGSSAGRCAIICAPNCR